MSGKVAAFLRRTGHEGGASAVEFAMVAPLMLILLLGIFQFGWMQHSVSSLRSAMDIASRALLIDPTLTEPALQAIVTARLNRAANTDVIVTLTTSDVTGGKVARLRASYMAEFGIPGLASFAVPYQITKTTVLKGK